MMRLPPFTYLAPRRVDEAVRLLAEHGADAMVVAGGTDLYPNMKRRQFEPKVLVGLRGIRELAGVGGSPREGLRIGAATTLTRVAAHPDVATHYPALARAARASRGGRSGPRRTDCPTACDSLPNRAFRHAPADRSQVLASRTNVA